MPQRPEITPLPSAAPGAAPSARPRPEITSPPAAIAPQPQQSSQPSSFWKVLGYFFPSSPTTFHRIDAGQPGQPAPSAVPRPGLVEGFQRNLTSAAKDYSDLPLWQRFLLWPVGGPLVAGQQAYEGILRAGHGMMNLGKATLAAWSTNPADQPPPGGMTSQVADITANTIERQVDALLEVTEGLMGPAFISFNLAIAPIGPEVDKLTNFLGNVIKATGKTAGEPAAWAGPEAFFTQLGLHLSDSRGNLWTNPDAVHIDDPRLNSLSHKVAGLATIAGLLRSLQYGTGKAGEMYVRSDYAQRRYRQREAELKAEYQRRRVEVIAEYDAWRRQQPAPAGLNDQQLAAVGLPTGPTIRLPATAPAPAAEPSPAPAPSPAPPKVPEQAPAPQPTSTEPARIPAPAPGPPPVAEASPTRMTPTPEVWANVPDAKLQEWARSGVEGAKAELARRKATTPPAAPPPAKEPQPPPTVTPAAAASAPSPPSLEAIVAKMGGRVLGVQRELVPGQGDLLYILTPKGLSIAIDARATPEAIAEAIRAKDAQQPTTARRPGTRLMSGVPLDEAARNVTELVKRAVRDGIPAWRVTPERPGASMGWISPDGRQFVQVGIGENDYIHSTVAAILLDPEIRRSKSDPNEALDVMLHAGWVRKALPGSYHIGEPTREALNAIENDLILTRRYGGVVYIDYEKSEPVTYQASAYLRPEDYAGKDLYQALIDYDRQAQRERSRHRGGYELYSGIPLPQMAQAFYSYLRKVIDDKMPAAAPASQVWGLVKGAGVPEAELRWTGLADYLTAAGSRKVTKEEVQKLLDEGRVQVEETRLPTASDSGSVTSLANGYYRVSFPGLQDEVFKTRDQANSTLANLRERFAKYPAKYSQYTLPGPKDNYREVLLRYRPQEPIAAEQYDYFPKTGRQLFTGGHFSEIAPNVFAHARVDDRVTADGRKVLFIEEVQSDWARAARETEGAPPEGATPDFPFRKNWHEVLLKRLLRLAADEGYDGIAWTTGRQQADRYNLRKYISRIEYDGYVERLVADGRESSGAHGKVIDESVKLDKLEDYIGKEPAAKIREQLAAGKEVAVLEGTDLEIGGEWAINLYDQMLPQFLAKYAKKWGATPTESQVWTVPPGRGELTVRERVHSLPITPSMKADVQRGQRLFSGIPLDDPRLRDTIRRILRTGLGGIGIGSSREREGAAPVAAPAPGEPPAPAAAPPAAAAPPPQPRRPSAFEVARARRLADEHGIIIDRPPEDLGWLAYQLGSISQQLSAIHPRAAQAVDTIVRTVMDIERDVRTDHRSAREALAKAPERWPEVVNLLNDLTVTPANVWQRTDHPGAAGAYLLLRRMFDRHREAMRDAKREFLIASLSKAKVAELAKDGKTPQDYARKKIPDNWGIDRGWYMHAFPGDWAVWRNAAEEGERPDWQPIDDLGWRSTTFEEALWKAAEYSRQHPDQQLRVGLDTIVLGDTKRDVRGLADSIKEASMLQADDLKEAIKEIGEHADAVAWAPRRVAQRFLGSAQRREAQLGGWARDFETLETYIRSVNRYIHLMRARPTIFEARNILARLYRDAIATRPSELGSAQSKLVARLDEAIQGLEGYSDRFTTRLRRDLQARGLDPAIADRAADFVMEIEALAKLGYSPVSAFVNLTQTLAMTYPVLGERYTLAGIAGAVRNIASREYDWLLDRLGVESQSSRLEVESLADLKRTLVFKQKADGTYRISRTGTARELFKDIGLFLFSKAEYANRAIAVIGAYEKGLAQGMSQDAAVEYARDVMVRTQGLYHRIDRPHALLASQEAISNVLGGVGSLAMAPVRGAGRLLEAAGAERPGQAVRTFGELAGPVAGHVAGRTFTQFKKFTLMSMEYITGLRGAEVARFWLVAMPLLGTLGMVALEPMDDLLKMLSGGRLSIRDWLSDHFPRASRGVTGFIPDWAGGPVDLTRNVGFSEYFGPGTFGGSRILGPAGSDVANLVASSPYLLWRVSGGTLGDASEDARRAYTRFLRGLSPELRRAADEIARLGPAATSLLDWQAYARKGSNLPGLIPGFGGQLPPGPLLDPRTGDVLIRTLTPTERRQMLLGITPIRIAELQDAMSREQELLQRRGDVRQFYIGELSRLLITANDPRRDPGQRNDAQLNYQSMLALARQRGVLDMALLREVLSRARESQMERGPRELRRAPRATRPEIQQLYRPKAAPQQPARPEITAP